MQHTPPSANPSPARAPAVADADRRRLANAVEGEVRFSQADRLLYATDASIYQAEPLGVIVPASAADACAAVAACAELGLPVLPRGGGTRLAGQCVNRAVVVDLSARCTALLETDNASRTCFVEPGITIDDLNDTIAATGLFFAPDPSTARQATVGGCIGNNAAGAHSILYGRTSENVLGVDLCLADGRRVTLDEGAALRDQVAAELTTRVVDVVRRHEALIRERFPKTLRRSAGYQLDVVLQQLDAGAGDLAHVNLAPLICGAEGTLGLTVGARLKLHPVPKAKGLAVVAFAGMDEAIDAVLPLLEHKPAAIELLDDLIIDLALKNTQQRANVELLPQPGGRTPRAVLYIEFFDADPAAVRARLDAVRALFGESVTQTHTAPDAMARAWALRKAGEPLLHGVPGHRKPLGFIEDNAIPPDRLAEFVTELREIVQAEGTIASYYAHASVGVLHVRPLLDLRSEADERAMHRIAERTAALAKRLGGVMSGEHGDGRARGPFLPEYFGPELMKAFGEIKAIFDPGGRMNPGNIVEPGPIASISAHVRVRPEGRDVRIPDVDTFYDYADQGDFAHAVEMCNGAGVCRKKTGGVMCPSYMATLDERHSTRGRGNHLRLAISGQVDLKPGSPAWDDAETKQTLDLCLSCKACKSECPSNVDIARLKAEYTAQGYKHGAPVPMQSRVFGKIHALNRLARLTPGMVNFVNTFAPSRALANRLLGLHPRRSLPRFERPLRKRWGHDSGGLPADAPTVALYADTFTQHNEPGIGLAARRLLEAFGYRVRPVWGTAAARALLSVGLLEDAIAQTDRELRTLLPAIEGTEALLFVEPSCMSAVTDDWPMLNCETPKADRAALAERCALVEQFIDDRWEAHPVRPAFNAPEGEVVLHAHCHQKALWGAASSGGALERAFPGRVRTLDTSCCGLAGSFGYTRERFDLSMRVGELGVLPEARRRNAGDVLTMPGTSCRHQAKDGAGTRALHPVELMASSLA